VGLYWALTPKQLTALAMPPTPACRAAGVTRAACSANCAPAVVVPSDPIRVATLVTSRDAVRPVLDGLAKDTEIKRACTNKGVARRYQELLDLVSD
jgi:hypothetical protein